MENRDYVTQQYFAIWVTNVENQDFLKMNLFVSLEQLLFFLKRLQNVGFKILVKCVWKTKK